MIRAPSASGSYFFNYKGTHSIVLLAIVDSNYKFIFVDIGCNGRVSDGGVFYGTAVAKGLREKKLALPEPSPLPGREKPVPYVILADDAFSLQENIMKPYPFKNNDVFCRVFNYRLSRARRMVESSFGILATRFRVLLKPIHLNPDKALLVVQATTVLHNYLIQNSLQVYAPPGTVDRENENGSVASGFWRDEFNPVGTLFNISQQSSNRHSMSAREIQREFAEYFLSQRGEVSWQYQLV